MRRQDSRRFLVFSVAFAAIIGAYAFGVLESAGHAASRGVSAIAAPVYAVSHRLALYFTQRKRDRGISVAELTASMDALIAENARLKSLVAENEALKTALRYRESAETPMVLARIISEASGDERALIVDRGIADGVRIGQPAVTGDGIIVGKVIRVRQETSVIRLLSDVKSKLAVSIQTAKETLGVLEGDRGIGMGISLIPQQADIRQGDTVVTSGIEPGIMRGLIIGTIERIEHNEQEPFQSAAVSPLRSALYPMFVHILLTETSGI